jgi:hypothetical protein
MDWRTFLGPCGLRDDFLRFPYGRCQTMVTCIDEEGMLLDVPWLQITLVDKGEGVLQGQNLSEVCLSDQARTGLTEARPTFVQKEKPPCLSLLAQWVAPIMKGLT